MQDIYDKKTEITAFPLDRFFDRHRENISRGQENIALVDLQQTIPLHTKLNDNLVYIARSFKQAGYNQCADYILAIIVINQMEISIEKSPDIYGDFDGRDDLQHKYSGVGHPKLDENEGTVFRTFKRQVWALLLNDAPNSEKYAERHENQIAMLNITYGDLLEYRKWRAPLTPKFKAAAEKTLHERVVKLQEKQTPLKRRPKL